MTNNLVHFLNIFLNTIYLKRSIKETLKPSAYSLQLTAGTMPNLSIN
jgi:hypothetical protein